MAGNVFKSVRNAVFFIAEIGGNHEGDFEYASRLTALAIKSGADAVKFQLYTGDTLVSSVESPDRNAHFKKFELGRDRYLELADRVTAADRMFMASVWDASMLDWIDPYIPIHKVGSGDLTCVPLIRLLAKTGKPLIVSTGLSSLTEIESMIRHVEKIDRSYIDDGKLALLQCTSSYPCPDEDVNLRAMETLKQEFGLPVGFSDHSVGTLAVEAAVAMGAVIIEKHFTDDRTGKVFRDHKVSITCEEMQELLPRLHRIVALRGNGGKTLTTAEQVDAHEISFRRSVYAACDIAADEIFTTTNLTVLRPATGVPASRFDDVVGKRAAKPIPRHHVIRESDFV